MDLIDGIYYSEYDNCILLIIHDEGNYDMQHTMNTEVTPMISRERASHISPRESHPLFPTGTAYILHYPVEDQDRNEPSEVSATIGSHESFIDPQASTVPLSLLPAARARNKIVRAGSGTPVAVVSVPHFEHVGPDNRTHSGKDRRAESRTTLVELDGERDTPQQAGAADARYEVDGGAVLVREEGSDSGETFSTLPPPYCSIYYS